MLLSLELPLPSFLPSGRVCCMSFVVVDKIDLFCYCIVLLPTESRRTIRDLALEAGRAGPPVVRHVSSRTLGFRSNSCLFKVVQLRRKLDILALRDPPQSSRMYGASAYLMSKTHPVRRLGYSGVPGFGCCELRVDLNHVGCMPQWKVQLPAVLSTELPESHHSESVQVN